MKHLVTYEDILVSELYGKYDREEYQRRLSSKLVNEIAASWDDNKAGEIRVSRRPDGELSVIDGQHRVEAAHMSHVERLRCQVWNFSPDEGEDVIAAEAQLFQVINSVVKPLIPAERFKAGLRAGDEKTNAIMRIVKSQGLKYETYTAGRPSREPKTIYGSGVIQRVYEWEDGASILNETLVLLRETWPNDVDGFQSIIINGTAYFVKQSQGSYDKDTFVRAVGVLPASVYVKQARTQAVIGVSGYQYMIIAENFRGVYNRAVKKNQRIEWD